MRRVWSAAARSGVAASVLGFAVGACGQIPTQNPPVPFGRPGAMRRATSGPGMQSNDPPPQPALPPSSPTAIAPVPQSPAQALSVPGAPQRAQGPAQRARIQVTGRMLEITADDSSLNQILRDVSRATGMTITGGVADERVYGTYGPADISAVLTRLLDGMGSNMLLVQNAKQQPVQLVLTPQHGGATPPNPFTGRHDDDNPDLPPQLQPHVQSFAPPGPPPGRSFEPTPPAAQANVPAAAEASATATPTTTVQSPNGVKTPQEIYEQLMKMQQGTAKPGTTTKPQ